MKHEYSCGAVLYRNISGHYEYMIVRDRHDHNSFPKGHKLPKEDYRECARREIREETGLDVVLDEYFEYDVTYKLSEGVEKTVTYMMADIGDAVPVPFDGELKDIWMLRYEEAYDLLTFDQLKEVLKEVNDRLVNDMKICCMFKEGAEFHRRNLQLVKYYGSECNGHDLYTWDEGDRTLFRCKECGAYVLEQYSEIHMPDAVYTDYFPVRDEAHAEEINEKYDGWAIERRYPYKKIFFTRHDD